MLKKRLCLLLTILFVFSGCSSVDSNKSTSATTQPTTVTKPGTTSTSPIPDATTDTESITTEAPTTKAEISATTTAPPTTTKSEPTTNKSTPTTTSTVSTEKIVYWVSGGKSYHYSKYCPTLSRSKNILEGSQSKCPKSDPCDKCVK